MTTFLIILAAIHFIGLFVMLFALRTAPVGRENANGFEVIAEAAESAPRHSTQPVHA